MNHSNSGRQCKEEALQPRLPTQTRKTEADKRSHNLADHLLEQPLAEST